MFSLLECKSGVTSRMGHAGFCSGEELIVEPFTEATTVTEYSLGERKRRAWCAARLLQASRLPFIRESSHPPGMSHLRRKKLQQR